MNPDRAAAIFRELLQTPEHELDQFSVRNALPGHPHAGDLSRARELLQAMVIALQSGPGPNWARVADAHQAMVAAHGRMNVPAAGPAPPAWIRDMPAKPTLGDPAPGTHQAAAHQQKQERFIPVAKPQVMAPPVQPVQPAPPQRQPPPPPKREPAPQTAAMPAQPEAPAAAGGVHESVATYAAFCAACANQPERAETIQREYGIAHAAHRATIDELWQDRFDDDAELQQQWEGLFAQFRAS
jgi:hypothetical protein